MAVEGISSKAIEIAAERFVQGKVAGRDNEYAPSSASFAEECRRQEALIRYASQPRLTPPEPIQSIPVEPWKINLWREAFVRGHRPSFETLKKLFAHNPDIANAEFREKEKDNGK